MMNSGTRSPSIDISPANQEDAPSCLDCLSRAFAGDPLMAYFFGNFAGGPHAAVSTFFSQLMQARFAISAPVLAMRVDGRIAGAAMGYAVARPAWPEALAQQWDAWVDFIPGLAAKFDAYDSATIRYAPPQPHHYLGVIGVDPVAQGCGAGKALLEAYCGLAAADTASSGTYLETASPPSLDFYLRNGFVLRGDATLEGTRLWCVFRAAR